MFTRDETGAACLGGTRLSSLVAPNGPIETPAYFYDTDAMAREAAEIRQAFGEQRHLVAYAVKANSAGPIVRRLRAEGTGCDVVSGAELSLAMACGVPPDDVVFSGVAKQDREIDLALSQGERGILSVQIESVEELARVAARARALSTTARISLRVNPGIEADTHAHIATGHDEAKFGIVKRDVGHAMETLLALPELQLVGLSTHIGSQLTATEDYLAAARMLLELSVGCESAVLSQGGKPFDMIDFGGGFGIDYGTGCPVRPRDFVSRIVKELDGAARSQWRAVVEPGRSLVASHGVLVARTIMQKQAQTEKALRHWLMIDAGMNDLLRPALYQALHRIEPLESGPHAAEAEQRLTRVVGPVCESSDDFGSHLLPTHAPTHVVIRDTGAYGFTMASEYNGRALPTEVFLEGGRISAMIQPRSRAAWLAERLATTPVHFPLGKFA